MKDWFANRTKRLEVSGIRKMFEMADADSINLGLGELDFEPIEEAKVALGKAVADGHNGYGPTRGLPALREEIANSLQKYRPDVTMDNIMITAGATQGILVSAMTLFDHGDEILVPDPGFVLYRPHAIMCGAFPVSYHLRQENEFVPEADEILELITPNTKAMIINSPNNPTSGMMTHKDIEEIRKIAVEHDIAIISDEVYDRIILDGEHASMLNADYDNVIYINSFSKTFAMTGWRVGFLAAPQNMIEQLSKIQYYNIACPPTPLQHATLAALRAPTTELERRVGLLRKRRDLIVGRLNKMDGFKCLSPRGAFYAFPKFEHSIFSQAFAMKLLDAGVICSPGSAFGKAGEGHLRFSFANSYENIEKGMDIVEEVAAEIPIE